MIAVLLLVLALASCTDLIGPTDPAYEDECVLYVAEGEPIQIPVEMLDRCESVEIRVVEFG